MRTSLYLKNILQSSERFANYVLAGQRRPGRSKALLLAQALEVPLEHVMFPDKYGMTLETLIKERLIATPTTQPEGEEAGNG